jgi:hypothetical protein
MKDMQVRTIEYRVMSQEDLADRKRSEKLVSNLQWNKSEPLISTKKS